MRTSCEFTATAAAPSTPACNDSGLRRIELVRLRVKDIDFDYRQVRVINGKDGRHRMVTLADELLPALRGQVGLFERFLSRDRAVEHYAGMWLSDALARKYPSAPFELGWHYFFPASRLSIDPSSACLRRHHFDENNLNEQVMKAARDAGIRRAVSCHMLRQSFATHLRQSGADSRTVQQPLATPTSGILFQQALALEAAGPVG